MRLLRLTVILVAVLAVAAVLAQRPRGRFPGMRGGYASLENPPLAKDDAEKRILEASDQVERVMSVPPEDGRVIRLLTEAVGAKHAVEIGTSTGYSGLWFALALKNTGGRLTTFEINPRSAAAARENFRKAGVESLITIVEGDAHQNVRKLKGPIDIVFIDADKEGYRDYLEAVLPLVRPGGLILAHNVGSRGENPEYVDAVTKNPQLDTILVGSQMAVTLKKR
jgi:predicted O-methyltransferase YrrM